MGPGWAAPPPEPPLFPQYVGPPPPSPPPRELLTRSRSPPHSPERERGGNPGLKAGKAPWGAGGGAVGGGIERLCPLAAAPPARRSPNMAAALRRSFASEKRPPHKRSVPPPAPHPPPAPRMDVGGPQPPLGVRHRLGRLCPKGGGGGTFRPRGGGKGGCGETEAVQGCTAGCWDALWGCAVGNQGSLWGCAMGNQGALWGCADAPLPSSGLGAPIGHQHLPCGAEGLWHHTGEHRSYRATTPLCAVGIPPWGSWRGGVAQSPAWRGVGWRGSAHPGAHPPHGDGAAVGSHEGK